MPSWAKHITGFYRNIQPPDNLPKGVGVLMPYSEPKVIGAMENFYKNFYGDNTKRTLLLGINPGRFGGGVTGIPFTDPIRLQDACGIENAFDKKAELSSIFMYEMMAASGGVFHFYKNFYISSVSPLGFIKNARNLNYYDEKILQEAIEPFAVQCMETQLAWGLNTDTAFCIGEGKNLSYFMQLNKTHGWFKQIIGLAHPRFIMQYKRKSLQDYIHHYAETLAPFMK
jgi:hypothetical protein